jgi:hypothetical protein
MEGTIRPQPCVDIERFSAWRRKLNGIFFLIHHFSRTKKAGL